MQAIPWLEQDGVRRAGIPGREWLRSVQVARVDGPFVHATPAGEETALVILAGTFDLAAGGGAWAQRGIRATPFTGRPCALYLPPATTLRAAGTGELLLIACRRPELPSAATPPPQMRPLLPLAGSGKAFDARTGAWELIERFPSSPEAVLPRAIARIDVAGVAVERVFPVTFKALALCVDEAVLAPGQALAPPPPEPGSTWTDAEVALFVRAAGTAEVAIERTAHAVQGDAVFAMSASGLGAVTARGGQVYLACAWAQAKESGR